MADKKEIKSLADVIRNDKSLKDNSNLPQFISLANLFELDGQFTPNLYLTSVELEEKYADSGTTRVGWNNFLKHNSVKKYLDSFREENLETKANKQLESSDLTAKDALAIKKEMDSKRKADDNSNIVVIFLPQKDYHL